jgi:hypothetical protein
VSLPLDYADRERRRKVANSQPVMHFNWYFPLICMISLGLWAALYFGGNLLYGIVTR